MKKTGQRMMFKKTILTLLIILGIIQLATHTVNAAISTLTDTRGLVDFCDRSVWTRVCNGRRKLLMGNSLNSIEVFDVI